MATYYSSPNNQRDSAPILYQREPHLTASYPEAASSVISSNMMIYMGSDSYSDALADMPPPPPSMGGDHGFPELTSSGGAGSVVHVSSGQGLSLSLGTQIPSGSFRSPNMVGFTSFLSPSSASRDEQQSRGSAEYFPPLGFGDQDSSKGEMSSSSPYGMMMMMPMGGGGGGARAVPSSKYLKAAQQLLDEVVNVRKAMMKQEEQKVVGSPKEGEEGSRSESTPGGGGDSAGNSTAQPELSHAEKQELQNKLTKLLSMLDEVDRRYKQYYHQMQIVVSSFDAIAGGGSAKPYTALALQTISRHFRCLRDAIMGQIKATRRSLGEDEASGNAKGVGISRLRFVDQQLRQQRALQHLGMMQQHAWRPQRGLPETSVSILRAWLFEHFLHPYPKDSDKIMLARQTGLTRSQVSNWFINARVRLWKPMVEEMYKEETGDAADVDSNSSSENASKKGLDVRASEETGEDLQQQQQQQQSGSSTGTGQFMDTKPDHVPPDVEMAGGLVGGPEYGGLSMLMKQQRRDDCGSVGLYPDVSFHSEGGNNERLLAAAAAAYQMSDMGRYGVGSGGVSLTLGLQHCDVGGGATMPIPQHHQQHGFVAVRGHDGMYHHHAGAPPPNVGSDGADFDQPRFASSSHLLHDFVV